MRTPLTDIIRSLVLAGVAILALGAAPAMGATVTADFDDLPAGTWLVDQYESLDLSNLDQPAALVSFAGPCGIVEASADRPGGQASPILPPSLPHWAKATGSTNDTTEFPQFTACARFADGQTNVSFVLGSRAFAYFLRANGQTAGPITLEPGLRTLSSGAGSQITALQLRGPGSARVYVDNLTYFSSTTPDPVFSVAPDPTLGVRAGSTANQALRVRHRYGDDTASSYAIVPNTLPAGVTASFSPGSLPSSTADQTVTVSLAAQPDVVPKDFTYQVRVTPDTGPARIVSVKASVTAPVVLQALRGRIDRHGTVQSKDSAYTCERTPYELDLSVPPSASPPPAPITVELAPVYLFKGSIVSRDGPATVTVPGNGTTVTVNRAISWGSLPESGTQIGAIRADARFSGSQGSGTATVIAAVDVTGSRLDSVNELAGGAPLNAVRVSAPRWLRDGNLLRLDGARLCPGSTVTIGASQPVPLHSLSADHRQATVRIPRDATPSRIGRKWTGLVVTPPGGIATVAGLTDFQLPRASSLFAFENGHIDGGIGWARWVESYGSQLQIDINPCAALTVGLLDCSIKKVADPIQYAVWGIGNFSDAGAKGLCFGHVMLSDWLERGLRSRALLAAPGRSSAKDNYSMADAQTAELQHEIERRFVTQYSSEYQARSGGGERPTFVGAIGRLHEILDKGRDAWLAVRAGGKGHIVRATDLRVGSGKAFVDLLNSNVPFTTEEALKPADHKWSLAMSTLSLTRRADGRYDFTLPLEGFTGTSKSGGDGLRIIDPHTVPQTFSSPLTVGAQLKDLVSASSSDSQAELVDSAGKPLPDQDSSVRLGGLGKDDGVDLTAKANGPVFLRTTAGDGAAQGQVVRRAGTIVALRGTPGGGKSQQVGVMPDGSAMVPAGTGSGRTLAVARKVAGVRRMVELKAPSGVGAKVAITATGASVRGEAGAGTTTLRLTTVAKKRSPAPVMLAGIRLHKGETVGVPRRAFQARPGQRVRLRLRRNGRTRTMTVKARPGAKLVKSLKAKATRKRITATLRTVALDDAALAILSYEVRRRGRRVARGRIVADAAARAKKTLKLKVKRNLRKGDVVHVVGLARRGDGTTMARRHKGRVR